VYDLCVENLSDEMGKDIFNHKSVAFPSVET